MSRLLRRLEELPDDLWVACPRCSAAIYHPKLRRSARVCPDCGFHLRLPLAERLDVLLDPGSFTEHDADLASADPLSFVDRTAYADRLAALRARTGRVDAAAYGTGTVAGLPVVACVLDFEFMGGSMGSVVGEKVARAAELAAARRVPLLTCASSGGARMQEGVFSLLQMAKVALVLRRLAEGGQPHICVLVDPVYGGVSASFTSLADVILAEPDARAGFAGPQVIEQTIRQRLPDGFQTADFLLEHGHIDAVVPRAALRPMIARLLAFHDAAARGVRVRPAPDPTGPTTAPTTGPTTGPAVGRKGSAVAPVDGADPWERVRLARHPRRPIADDYLRGVFDDVVELRGDRQNADDPAVFGGLALFEGAPVVVVAHRKGRGTAESVARNFGMPGPYGYAKARRLMEYAERFGVPVITLVDTPGAYPGVSAEEGNQSGAIAANLSVLAGLRTPVVAVVTGEGGSGGALATGVADRLLMLENATLSVISPEGCATILFGDVTQAPRAARALRLTAPELYELGVVAEVVPEPPGGAHRDAPATVAALRAALRRHLAALTAQDGDDLLARRAESLRSVGPVTALAKRPEEGAGHAGARRARPRAAGAGRVGAGERPTGGAAAAG